MIATGAPRLVQSSPAQPTSLEKYVDELLEEPRTAKEAANVLVPRAVAGPTPFSHGDGMVLRYDSGARVYFLRSSCAREQAERVRPWWALSSTIRVCPDAHRPDRLMEPVSGNRCGGNELAPQLSGYCGCGPNLVFCARDSGHLTEIRDSLRGEVFSTVEHVVRSGLYVADLFRQNETVRDRNAEFRYRRWRIAN
jgi:hypothetical protein